MTPFKYRAVGDKVLVEAPPYVDPKAESMAFGIVVPQHVVTKMKLKDYIGLKVLAVGPDVKVAKPGDIAWINRHNTDQFAPLDIDAMRIYILPESTLAVICDGEPCRLKSPVE